jgi:hypothetical protein
MMFSPFTRAFLDVFATPDKDVELVLRESKLPMHLACRCSATSKRSGLRRRSPAVRGASVCRMHGAAGGARRLSREGDRPTSRPRHGDADGEPASLNRSFFVDWPGLSSRACPSPT